MDTSPRWRAEWHATLWSSLCTVRRAPERQCDGILLNAVLLFTEIFKQYAFGIER